MELPRYIDVLRRRRAQGGVLAVKLQFRHFDRYLRNRSGAALFEGACIVHLFRPDVASQYASFRAAAESGEWDFTARPTSAPRVRDRQNSEKYFREAVNEVNRIIGEDAGFRSLFVLLNIRPIFVTSDELFRDPRAVVRQIAQAVAVPVNKGALEHSIALSAPYGHDRQRENAVVGLADAFRKLAFQRRS
jgi:LPS sulfotransferase NodH